MLNNRYKSLLLFKKVTFLLISVVIYYEYILYCFSGKNKEVINMSSFKKLFACLAVVAFLTSGFGGKTHAATKPIDSYTYSDYFTSAKWITRDKEISLSVYPKTTSPLITSHGNVQMVHATRAFSHLKSKWSGSSKWKNTKAMEAQFHCHVMGAGKMKTPWNLEPHRTETSLTKTILNGCNPEN